ncbi:MAG: hypothetical protein ACXVC7_17475 [Bacteroidia bacterium]
MATVSEFFKKLREVSVTSLFLKEHVPLPSTIKLLQDIYPNINWSRVDFYEGLPWFTPLIAPYVTAQALPQFYSFGKYRIYLKKFDEQRAQCLADIVHEAYHIMQAMQFANGYGFGFLRGMMVYYNALFVKYGYRQNPFEIPAYDQEYRFLDYCNKHHVAGIFPPVAPHALDNIKYESALVASDFPFSYKENKLVLALAFILCLIISIIKPFADLIALIIRTVSSFKEKSPREG